jgi:hypothetical protein
MRSLATTIHKMKLSLLLRRLKNYFIKLLKSDKTYGAKGMPDPPPRVRRIFEYIRYFGRDRSLYVTSEGHYGLGPQTIENGDCIAVLLGGSLPAVLRLNGPYQYQWCLVGKTYLDGFGDGESILGLMPDGIEVVTCLDDNIESLAYLDQATGRLQIEDPRLGSLPADWDRKRHEEEHRWTWYVNVKTGEEKRKETGDPRLDYVELVQQGVRLQKLRLV